MNFKKFILLALIVSCVPEKIEISNFIYDIDANKIPVEIENTKSKLKTCKNEIVIRSLILDLAFFYSHPKNPHPNYDSTLKYLDDYIKISTEPIDRIKYIRELIFEIKIRKELMKTDQIISEKKSLKSTKLLNELNRLKKEKAELLKKINEMNKSNTEMNNNDLLIERQRKNR